MLWDDFARVGAPQPGGAVAHVLSLGQATFPPALEAALLQAALPVEEAPDAAGFGPLFRDRRPDLLILAASVLGPDPEMACAGLLTPKSPPAILVTDARMAPPTAPRATPFAEMMGAGQDALGYFLMLRATLRRKRPHAVTDVLSCGDLALDQETFTLSLRRRAARLNLLEFCVLGAMLDAPRMVWNKVFLNRVIFGPAHQKPGRQFDTCMSRVRRGLRDKLGADPIEAEHRLGYALSPSVLGVPGIAGSDVRGTARP
jgi:DNA-binding response OmpR family regulator